MSNRKPLDLLNFRRYHATNSSSSHSFIVIPREKLPDDYWESEMFGLEDFTLSSADAKRKYLSACLRASMIRVIPEDVLNILAESLMGIIPDPDLYVDQASVLNFPRDYHYHHLMDRDFLRAFMNWAMQDEVVILGGSDSLDHPLRDETAEKSVLTNLNGCTVARYDPKYHYWSIFNRETGDKARIRFPEDASMFQQKHNSQGRYLKFAERAFAPELVDMKITDICPFVTTAKCGEYCYQASKTNGTHADYYDIVRFLDVLSELKVWEVAIGGGEPTLHPEFVDILEYANNVGISPTFTTRNLAWLKNDLLRDSILRNAKAFAYSVHSVREVINLASMLNTFDVDSERVNLHVVMGTFDKRTFTELLKTAHQYNLRVTLLGYKTTGHGADFQPVDYSWWIDVLKEFHDDHVYPTICIDTPLAAEYQEKLLSAGVPNWMFYTQEGHFSAYYDAVKKRFSPSSYDGDGEHSYALDFNSYRYHTARDNSIVLTDIYALFP